LDRAKRGLPPAADEEEGELLCDTLFSLAYGTLLLLSHTNLRLIRGRRYGILGPNGSGKTTLMRQLRDGKVENFPPQSQLRCVMVEHALQGEDTSLTVVDFIAAGELPAVYSVVFIFSLCADKALADISRQQIKKQLTEVGFDEERQAQLVGSLSGGWKMRLELARAMLYNADLLLLDEVSL
jgi:elongation factor 3